MLIHPPLASFPFVILVLIFVFDGLALLSKKESCSTCSSVLCITALPLSLLTYLSGYFSSEEASRAFSVSSDMISQHETWGKLLLLSLFALFVLRLCLDSAENPKIIFPLYGACLIGSLALAGYTSFLGGSLIFDHGAGVSAEHLVPNH